LVCPGGPRTGSSAFGRPVRSPENPSPQPAGPRRPLDALPVFSFVRLVFSLKVLSAIEVYNPKVRADANELALEASESLGLPGVAGSDARTSLDEIGYAATLFKKPVNTQAELVKALLGKDYVPVQMGALPHLRRPGEAKQDEQQRKKKKRRWPR
ncbi:MAG: hypothetical protein INH41_04485, partial [Myxococcaceae bacterium]|nr:hypothetical protein [Myxococcaceae bacterium]